MTAKGIRLKRLVTGIAVFLIGVAFYAGFVYQRTQAALVDVIDRQLYSAAISASLLLGPDYHANLDADRPISRERDFAVAKKLTALARQANREQDIAYIYSLIERGGNIYFVSSSLSDEELAAGVSDTPFFSEYTEASDAVFCALREREVCYGEYRDRWGDFRSVYLRRMSSAGEPYVVGVDIDISAIKGTAVTSAAISALSVLFIGMITAPLILLVIRSYRREVRDLYFDAEMGIPNRLQLLADIDKSRTPNVCLVDIKRFTEIIHVYGPAVADDLLRQFANRLANYRNPLLGHYRAYRLAGDRFAALVDQDLINADFDVSGEFADFVRYVQSGEYQLPDDKTLRVSVSVGASIGQREALLLADMALCEARDTHQTAVIYNPDTRLPEVCQSGLDRALELRSALSEDRLTAYFQPVYDANSHQVVCYEALMRVLSPLGRVAGMPDHYLPVARQSGLYQRVTIRVIKKAVAFARVVRYPVSINLSTRDIRNRRTAHVVLQLVKKSRVAHRLQFELQEGEALHDQRVIRKYLLQLRRLGCRIGIDRFGTEYSNIDRLLQLPIDFIKIDGDLVERLAEDGDTHKMVNRVIALAKRKGLQTTASKCSSEAVTRLAEEAEVDCLQGYYLGDPAAQQVILKSFAAEKPPAAKMGAINP